MLSPSAESAVSFNYQQNSANQRVAITNADNSRWVYTYDTLGQVVSGKKYWSDGTPVAGQQFEYTFDDIGNRKSTATGGDQSGANLRTAGYTNNALNQLTSRGVPGYVDIQGSATNTATVTVNNQPTYRHSDYFRVELPANNSAAALWVGLTNVAVLKNGTNADIVASTTGFVFVAQSPEVFNYDADGNVTNDGRWTFTWDAENRLVAMVSLTNTPTESKRRLTFGYDYGGRRITKAVESWTGSSWTMTASNKFVYDGWNLLAELNATNNAVIRSYVWGLDLSGSFQGAGGVGGLLAVTDAVNGTHFVAHDGNGNVAALVNASDGTTSANYEYGPFGETLRATGLMASINPFRFSTKYQDNESDLLYYGYRYYSASIGRWLGRDPLEEQGGLNVCGFLGNDGLNGFDVLGWISDADARRMGLSQWDLWFVNMYDNAGKNARNYGRAIGKGAVETVKGLGKMIVHSVQDRIDLVSDPVGYYQRKFQQNLAMAEWLRRLATDSCEQERLKKAGKGWLLHKLTTDEGIGETVFFLESLLAGGLLAPEAATARIGTVADDVASVTARTLRQGEFDFVNGNLSGRLTSFESAAKRATQLELDFGQSLPWLRNESGLVIGRGRALSAPGALGPGEYRLSWQSVQETSGVVGEWAVNRAKLQNVMNLNLPIRDASPLSDLGGLYLNSERWLTTESGWLYRNGSWIPPKP